MWTDHNSVFVLASFNAGYECQLVNNEACISLPLLCYGMRFVTSQINEYDGDAI